MNNRKIDILLNTPSELSIMKAMEEVEKLPSDERVTKVVMLLSEAKDILSEYIDEKITEL